MKPITNKNKNKKLDEEGVETTPNTDTPSRATSISSLDSFKDSQSILDETQASGDSSVPLLKTRGIDYENNVNNVNTLDNKLDNNISNNNNFNNNNNNLELVQNNINNDSTNIVDAIGSTPRDEEGAVGGNINISQVETSDLTNIIAELQDQLNQRIIQKKTGASAKKLLISNAQFGLISDNFNKLQDNRSSNSQQRYIDALFVHFKSLASNSLVSPNVPDLDLPELDSDAMSLPSHSVKNIITSRPSSPYVERQISLPKNARDGFRQRKNRDDDPDAEDIIARKRLEAEGERNANALLQRQALANQLALQPPPVIIQQPAIIPNIVDEVDDNNGDDVNNNIQRELVPFDDVTDTLETDTKCIVTNIVPVPSESKYVKLGTHCINLLGTVNYMVCNVPVPTTTTPDFITIMRGAVLLGDRDIVYEENGFRVQSRMYRKTFPGIIQDLDPVLARLNVTLQPNSLVHRVNVRFHLPRVVGQIMDSDLTPITIGNDLNARQWEAVMAPCFQVNTDMLRRALGIAHAWKAGRCLFDNSAIYAKLIFFSMTRHRYRLAGIVPNINPILAVDNPHFMNINGDAAQWNASDINRAIQNNVMNFNYMKTYSNDRMNFIRLLGRSGNHYVSPAGARILPQQFIDWPAINIFILGNDIQPALVDPFPDLHEDVIWAFAMQLAQERYEVPYFMSGLYWVYQMFFCDLLPINNAPAANQLNSIITPFYERNMPMLPVPGDCNFIYRVMNIVSEYGENTSSEFMIVAQMDTNVRMLVGVLLASLIRSFTTTYLYDFNLTGIDIQRAITRINMSNSLNAFINCNPLFLSPQVGLANSKLSAQMYDSIRDAIFFCVGAYYDTSANISRSWNYAIDQQQVGGNDDYFAALTPNHPIRYYSPLAIDKWLTSRPIEWGLSKPGVTVDLSNENVIWDERVEVCGSFSFLGDKTYSARAMSSEPYPLVLYAPAFVNLFTQHAQTFDHEVVFSCSSVPLKRYSEAMWRRVDRNNYVQPLEVYEAFPIYDVCSVRTYSWNRPVVVCPNVLRVDNHENEYNALVRFGENPLPWIGLDSEGRSSFIPLQKDNEYLGITVRERGFIGFSANTSTQKINLTDEKPPIKDPKVDTLKISTNVTKVGETGTSSSVKIDDALKDDKKSLNY